jgi:hypothetical protein
MSLASDGDGSLERDGRFTDYDPSFNIEQLLYVERICADDRVKKGDSAHSDSVRVDSLDSKIRMEDVEKIMIGSK